MKYFAELSTVAISLLFLTVNAAADPVGIAAFEVRESIPDLAHMVHLEARKKKPNGSSNSTNNTAASLSSDGTLRLAGVAFLSSFMFLVA